MSIQLSSPEDREALLASILGRAETDSDFREGLLTEPREVIFEEFGVQIPPSFRIRFIERDPNVDALVVLPDYSGEDGEGELDDSELDCVNGGGGGGGGGGGW
ncbi:MAG: NHLP leader peptide family RiPP precursor [Holophagales bacterium]|nr:NHLP leader peptide family RiPP precursor [Holophagales bacterium]